jgi:hypothetical protein
MLFNYELNRRFHAVHRNGPSKLQKNGEKSTITIEYKHKKREKSLLNKKKSPFYRFFTAFQTSDIITPIYLFYLFSIQSHTN